MNATLERFERELLRRATIDAAGASIDRLIDRFAGRYAIKQRGADDVHILPVSGGADSTALAILMHRLFADTRFELVFTDTGAETPSVYETLDRLELYLGREIQRISSGATLYELIERWGGFLPSPNARACTSALKLHPFKAWLSRFESRPKWMYVGIRRDESQRIAFAIDEDETEMPFVDLGMVREDVYAILSATIGIPRGYRTRSRSGCACCPFMTRQEIVGLLQEQPTEFERGAHMEKLAPADQRRHAPATPLWKDTQLGANWLSLPLPADGAQIHGVNRARGGLLPDEGVWVGAEFMFDTDLNGSQFIWQQRVVTWSPSLAGLQKQLSGSFAHLLATREVHDMSERDVRTNVRFAVYFIEAPADVFDPCGPGAGSFTWKQGEAYQQLAHIIGWATRVLNAEQLRLEASQIGRYRETSWAWENANESVKALSRISAPTGAIVQSAWFTPAEPKVDDEIDEATVTCPVCSL